MRSAPRPAPAAPRRHLAATLAVSLAATLAAFGLAACDADDDPTPLDAPTGLDGPPGIDAPSACNLPSTIITCTAGDNAPCTAVCDTAYCYNFSQVGTLCTKACTGIGDCPSGWTCNNMGRCRPPG